MARLDPVETLQRLIRTASVNPMGQDVAGPIYGESRLTELLGEICRAQGWRCRRQAVHPGRDNLLVFIDGQPRPDEGGELLLWDVHQDTVPVEGMAIDPFGGEAREGRLYGRGASDVKGSMAAMLAALSRLDGRAAQPSIVLACTVNEECGFTGATTLGSVLDDRQWFPRRPDGAIVAEPTQFEIVVAHQGTVRWRCHTHGRAAHTSQPDAGINAIYGMARVVTAVEQFHRRLSSEAPAHRLCGRPSACVSTIRGGVAINTVPDRTTIEIDRRLSPEESPGAAYDELVQFVAENSVAGACRVEHDAPFMQSAGLRDGANRTLAERLSGVAGELVGGGRQIGAPYGTDAAAIAATGVPTVVFGPGSIAQAHTADEYIEVEQLELATEVFYRIACNGLR